jgi:hypothetical protein
MFFSLSYRPAPAVNCGMDLSFLRFTPVPVRARRDGWTPVLQRRFILNLARGMDVAQAARSLGRSRQTAYDLRGRPGGEHFARAWDAAMEFARHMDAMPRSPGSGFGGIEEIWVPRYYRGRLVGFVVREDLRGAMRRLGQLDRMAEKLGPPDFAAPDFETLLDMIDPKGGKAVETDAMRVRTRPPRQFPGQS